MDSLHHDIFSAYSGKIRGHIHNARTGRMTALSLRYSHKQYGNVSILIIHSLSGFICHEAPRAFEQL